MELRVLLLGGTDLTLAVAEHLIDQGLVGVVHLPRRFDISYSRTPVESARHSDLGDWCSSRGVPARSYNQAADIEVMAEQTDANFCLAAGWYHMIPRRSRQRFPLGCAAIHASLLPKYRGGAPLNWALMRGETETGVSLFEMGDSVDDGPLYGQRAFPIGARATVADLILESHNCTLELLDQVLPDVREGEVRLSPQSGTPSYGLQRRPEDGRIAWDEGVMGIDRLIRAVGRPYSGAFTHLEKRKITIWKAIPLDPEIEIFGVPGQIALVPECKEPCVVTGDGVLRVLEATDGEGRDAIPALARSNHKRFVW